MSFVQMKNSPINSPWQPWSEHDAYNAGISEIEHFYHSPCPLTRQCMPSIESVVEGHDRGPNDDYEKKGRDQSDVEPDHYTTAIVTSDAERTREDSAVAIYDPTMRLDGSSPLTTVEDISEQLNKSFSSQSPSSSSDLTELSSSPEPPQYIPLKPANNLSKKRTRMSNEERVMVEIPLHSPVKRRRIAPLVSQTQFSPRQTRQQRRHVKEDRARLTRGEELKRRASVLKDGKMYK